jgi:hypothetical protein
MNELKPPSEKQKEWLGLVFLLLVLVPVELFCAAAAFETLGDIDCSLYWLIVIGGNGLVLLLAIWRRFAAVVLAVALALAVIPYQLLLVHRLWQVQNEAARIVGYAYETKIQTGDYPADLGGYEYQTPATRKYIQGYHVDKKHGGFLLVYCVGTESTSHWYSPKDGWSYYPD